MARVQFKSKGKTVSFTAGKKRKKGAKRKLTAYQRFAKAELKKQYKKGAKSRAAMKAVGKAWRAKKRKK